MNGLGKIPCVYFLHWHRPRYPADQRANKRRTILQSEPKFDGRAQRVSFVRLQLCRQRPSSVRLQGWLQCVLRPDRGRAKVGRHHHALHLSNRRAPHLSRSCSLIRHPFVPHLSRSCSLIRHPPFCLASQPIMFLGSSITTLFFSTKIMCRVSAIIVKLSTSLVVA